jgi:Flp pilus assembly protein TadD
MELTIEEALQRAINAHREGKLQDAEALYRAILQSQPMHPDANHNLGVLEVSINKLELAVPLFKTALEAKPSQGQFWVSYIDALIKTNQLDSAKSVIGQGRKMGLAGGVVDALEAQLSPIAVEEVSKSLTTKQDSVCEQHNKKENLNYVDNKKLRKNQSNHNNKTIITNPSQTEVNALLENYQNGRFEMAEKLARGITEKNPRHQLSWKVLAAVFKQSGKLQDSLIANKKAVNLIPKDAEAHNNLGDTLLALGRLEEAETSFNEAIRLKSDYAEAHNNLGITLSELGRLGQSEDSYKKAIAIRYDYFEAYNNLGITLKKLGKLEEAVENYKIIIGLNPNLIDAYTNLGIILKELGRLEEAQLIFKKVISLNPDNAEAHSNLGVTLQELGRLEEAEESYRNAITLNPILSQAHYNLGITLQKLGRIKQAEENFIKAIAIKPEFIEAYNCIGAMFHELGRLEEARAIYGKAIELQPAKSESHHNLGVALQKLGRLEEAAQSYKEAISLKPDNVEALSNLGATFFELGKSKEAEECYKKAIALKPDFLEAQYNLATFFVELRKYKQAVDLLIKLNNFKNSGGYLLKCLYFLNEEILFYEHLDALINQGEVNALLGSFSCRAEIKYGNSKLNSFCNTPLQYLFKTDLNNEYDFQSIFINPTLKILQDEKMLNRAQSLLTNGHQTAGNLFTQNGFAIDEIKRIINIEIEKYRLQFKDSDDGLIKHWPDAYSLYGWLISLKSGGELRPHMHENGWLSGSIYINVPPKSNINDGNLVVCIEEDKYLNDPEKSKSKIIDVSTGSLCLFPASLLHYTIPFKSNQERIVLAFDVVPKQFS